MKITLKVRFNTVKESFEDFGNHRYLLYLPFPDDGEAISLIKEILSRRMGVPANKIDYLGEDAHKDKVFEIY